MSLAPTPVQDPRAAFAAELGAIRRRLWLERVGVLLTRGLMLGFLFTLLVAVAGWGLRIPIQPLWYAAPLLVPLILNTKPDLMTVPVVLVSLIGDNAVFFGLLCACSLIAMLPTVALVMLLQRYVVEGLTAGAVKA